jgi:hypothetical protein
VIAIGEGGVGEPSPARRCRAEAGDGSTGPFPSTSGPMGKVSRWSGSPARATPWVTELSKAATCRPRRPEPQASAVATVLPRNVTAPPPAPPTKPRQNDSPRRPCDAPANSPDRAALPARARPGWLSSGEGDWARVEPAPRQSASATKAEHHRVRVVNAFRSTIPGRDPRASA